MPQPIPELLADVLAFLEEVEDIDPIIGSQRTGELSAKAHMLAQRLRARGVDPSREDTDPNQPKLFPESSVSVDDAEHALEEAMQDL
jgi:hypothetical protein